MKMTENELAELDREDMELLALFQQRRPTMDTIARMFPNLGKEPMIDDMEVTPMPRIRMHFDGETAFVGAIRFSTMMVLLIIIFGWLL